MRPSQFVSVLMAVLSGCLPLTPHATRCGVTDGFEVYADDVGTCPAALALVPATIRRGEELGLWNSSATWGCRLEVMQDLAEIGYPRENGITVTGWGCQMALGGVQPWLAGHEFIHVQHGDSDHCNWASKYQRDIGGFDGGGGGLYYDACQKKVCSEGDDWNCYPATPAQIKEGGL